MALFNAVGWPKPRQADRTQTGVVSILIPARNEEKNLAACLDSILKQGEVVLEIIVYDDHSTDGTASIISHYKESTGESDSPVRCHSKAAGAGKISDAHGLPLKPRGLASFR
ncbi:MAG: glycosyltransferase [Acidobacteria bacterium]|nr:glycosyltransferase [Acidobacteriota bacterium]